MPYVVEQDEDGVWCASAQLRPGVAAFGDGADSRKPRSQICAPAVELLIEEVGPPDEMTLDTQRRLISGSFCFVPSSIPAIPGAKVIKALESAGFVVVRSQR